MVYQSSGLTYMLLRRFLLRQQAALLISLVEARYPAFSSDTNLWEKIEYSGPGFFHRFSR